MVPARRPWPFSLATAAALVLVLAPAARAQPQPDVPTEAVELYRNAREHYEAGRYREAAGYLEQAAELDPDSPTLAYNLARVYELLGELDRSVEQYRRYQQLLPQQQAREQERAEATIRRLEGAAQSGQLETPEPPREVEPLRQLPGLVLVRENGVADTAFWVTLVGGFVALSAGAIFGGLALETHDAADSFVLGPDGRLEQRDELYGRASTFGIITDVSLGLGGVAVISAGLLFFLREHTVERAPVRAVDDEPEASLEASVGTDGQSLAASLRGSF